MNKGYPHKHVGKLPDPNKIAKVGGTFKSPPAPKETYTYKPAPKVSTAGSSTNQFLSSWGVEEHYISYDWSKGVVVESEEEVLPPWTGLREAIDRAIEEYNKDPKATDFSDFVAKRLYDEGFM